MARAIPRRSAAGRGSRIEARLAIAVVDPQVAVADRAAVALNGSGSRIEAVARKVFRRAVPERLAALAAALAHPVRIAVLMYLLTGPAVHKALVARTGLDGGPLYHHLRELRTAGLLGPRQRDLYQLTRRGRRAILAALAMEQIAR